MVLTIAHRGACSLAPENTLPSIKKAWELGADRVEIDVTTTLDGRLIVIHDDTLIRTTDIHKRFPDRMHGSCSAFTLKEIRCLDAGSWFVETDPFGTIAAGDIPRQDLLSFPGSSVPTLEEVLEFVKKHSWQVNIEIKKMVHPMEDYPITEAVLDLIDRMRIPADCVTISSFDHEYLRSVYNARPDIEINALIGDEETGHQDWGTYEFHYYNADACLIDEHQLAEASEHGCLVNLYTVNNQEDMLRFLKLKVRGLFTDYPQRLIRLQKAAERQAL